MMQLRILSLMLPLTLARLALAWRAVQVSDPLKFQGTILGKAMSSLKEGKGMVLVLVTLQ